jgi:hypothetical protein
MIYNAWRLGEEEVAKEFKIFFGLHVAGSEPCRSHV